LPSVSDEKVLKEFAVRLIGRLLFCWFLQKKTSDNGISLEEVADLTGLIISELKSLTPED